MLKYIDEKIKLEYIKWVTFIYDGNFNESIFSNEKLFKVFVEEKINEDIKRFFTDSNYAIKLYKGGITDKYYCTLSLNGVRKKFDTNNSYDYYFENKKDFDYMYYQSNNTIDLPF